MNTGQHLASLSSLPSGSALAHLLAATSGTGIQSKMVFASTFTVLIDEPVLHVGFPNKEIKPARQVAEVDVKPGKEIKRLFIETRPEDIVVTTSANTLTVVEVKV